VAEDHRDSEAKQRPPGPDSPPAVLVDDDGVSVWFGGAIHEQIRWSQVERVSVGVVAAPGAEYSEAFWFLEGDGVSLGAPVDLVMNAEFLNRRLFALPGFDQAAYEAARRAEAAYEPGDFVCWERGLDPR